MNLFLIISGFNGIGETGTLPGFTFDIITYDFLLSFIAFCNTFAVSGPLHSMTFLHPAPNAVFLSEVF